MANRGKAHDENVYSIRDLEIYGSAKLTKSHKGSRMSQRYKEFVLITLRILQ